jgi:predicted secreted protein
MARFLHLLCFAAIAASQPASLPASAPSSGAVVNESGMSATKKGETLNLQVGDMFEVRIPTIPASGFVWKPHNLNTQILQQVGDPVYEPGTSPNAAGGTTILKFQVVGAGSTPLNLIYSRAASGGGPSLYSQSFGITVNAK